MPLDNRFWIALKFVLDPAAGEDVFAANSAAFQPGYEGLERPVRGSMVTESLNGTMLQRASVCSESRLYDKLPVG
jgi:hypothetical protein